MNCTRAAVSLILLASGIASRYDPGVFERVSYNRGMDEWSGGHIAMQDCSLVGDIVLVCDTGGACWWARVTDCAGIADGGYAWMARNGIAGELDYDRGLHRSGKPIQVFDVKYGYDFD